MDKSKKIGGRVQFGLMGDDIRKGVPELLLVDLRVIDRLHAE